MRAEQLAHLNAELVRANSELAALATENATLYEREHEIASILQQSLLPAELPETAEFEFAALYQPSGEGIEVGGDFYDVFATPQGTAVVIGDVCGKGPAAARLTSLSRNTIRALATLAGERTASEILHRLNDAVIDQSGPAEYLTVTYILLASEQDGSATAAIASGGHLPPLVVRATGTVETVAVSGTIVGVVPEIEFQESSVELASGDALVLITDGLTECRNSNGSMFGEKRLHAVLAQTAASPFTAATILQELTAALVTFREGTEPRDDLVTLVARCRDAE